MSDPRGDPTGRTNATRIAAAAAPDRGHEQTTFTILFPPSFFDAFNASAAAADDNLTNGSTPTAGSSNDPTGSAYQTAFTILICGLIIFGTILGNSLICSAVAITRKLRTPSNLLIVSLAISDLLVGALDMPFAVMYEVTGSWSIGEVMCDFWTSIDVLFCTASILNICVISIDRYLVITKPFSYAMKRTPLRMVLMIALVWIVSAIISIPPLFGWKDTNRERNQCSVSQNKGYQFFATIGAFYLPLIIMVVIYTRIYIVSFRMTTKSARQSVASSGGAGGGAGSSRPYRNGRPRILSTTPAADEAAATVALFPRTPTPCNGTGPTLGLNGIGRGCNGHPTTGGGESTTPLTAVTPLTPVTPLALDLPKRSRTNSASLVDAILRLNCRQRGASGRGHERKATRTLGVIMGAFVACWLPFFILALIKPFCQDNKGDCIPHWLNSLFLWLGFANSLLNPIIYARFNREFRTPFKYILQCRCANINSRLRSEDFTEQFGRLQVSRHNSVYPPPLSLPTPPLPSVTLNSRHSSIFPPLIRVAAPSPQFRPPPPPPPPTYLTLPMNRRRRDSVDPTPLQSQRPPTPCLEEENPVTRTDNNDCASNRNLSAKPSISQELSIDMDTTDLYERNTSLSLTTPNKTSPLSLDTQPSPTQQLDDPSEEMDDPSEARAPSESNDCDATYRSALLEHSPIPVAQYCLLRGQ